MYHADYLMLKPLRCPSPQLLALLVPLDLRLRASPKSFAPFPPLLPHPHILDQL